ncbi:gephyrin-like molybdotransferase Glp [Methanobrevibacter sp. DSM 116169]|uniref:molybdopterin molybdotransferase MoeA n=1 Tax=Methanobrevibacter sp. DSM 116169 TaxID=3242727 RepID=UPI0038FC0505
MRLSKLLPFKDALLEIDNFQIKTDLEEIDLKDAHKRVLGEDIYSFHDSPPFDKSAMDGFAIIAEDSFGASQNKPKEFKIIDKIGAGASSNKTINHNEAITIATGSPIPEGANSVIMKEFTSVDGDNLEVQSQVTPKENISPRAEDIKKEDLILKSNSFIRPQEIGLIASAGYSKIKVYKKPKVKILITGNELVEPTKTLNKAQIINSNRYILSALIENCGALLTYEHVIDDFNKTKEAILNSSKEYDVIITTGGTALSKGDVVVDAASEVGELKFHGVSIRPGKPAAFAIVNNTPVFMLSGQPVAAMTQFDMFARKFIMNMQGANFSDKIVKRTSKVKIPSTLGRTDYIRAVSDDESTHHVLNRGSGIIRSMVEANSYIIIDENDEGIDEQDEVDILFFDSMNFNR